MSIEQLIQPFLVSSLVIFMFSLFFFEVPTQNNELVKMCLTSLISFISGSSLALALVRANKEDKRK